LSERRASARVVTTLTAGVVIGLVEVILAIGFASLVFGGYLMYFLPNGIGLFLMGGAITLAVVAWRAGKRGVVGGLQEAAAAILAVVALKVALSAFGSINRAFLTAVAAIAVVTIATGVLFVALGTLRLGRLVRYVPYPVVGGFLAGTGWLLLKGGVGAAAGIEVYIRTLRDLSKSMALTHWIPALAFGVVLLAVTRLVKRPIAIPATIGIALALFLIGMLVTGSSIDDVRNGSWLLGPWSLPRLWEPWPYRSLNGADWSALFEQAAAMATAVFVAVIACLPQITGVEQKLRKDLDADQEFRSAGVASLVSGPFGGIPGYHSITLTSFARDLNTDARAAGFVAALVAGAIALFGSSLVELIPRFLVGGVLAFVGLSLIAEWLFDAWRRLPLGEYLIVLAIFGTIAARGYLTGVAAGLVLAVILFAINYSRIDLVHQLEFGSTYRSNVDRAPAERLALQAMADRVGILRVNGYVFFGVASGLVERIRRQVEAGPLRFLLIDLRRVTGIDSSAVLAFRKIAQLPEAHGFELVFCGGSDSVLAKLQRGGIVALEGAVSFDPDLDHGLQRVEQGLLEEQHLASPDGSGDPLGELPARLRTYFERTTVPQGTVLIHQGDPPDDLFVLESGRLSVEATTPDGMRIRLSSVSSGVIVGEVALYLGGTRTADVVAETPSVVLRLSRASLDRMETEDPGLAAALHRRLAERLAGRVSDALRAYDALLD
jgi:SulP family sulfate permease